MSSPPRTGLILLAHGARDAAWATPFERVAAALGRMRPETTVQLAFLEFMTPDLPQAAQALIEAQRCNRLEVVPMFLGTGGHVRRDLPRLLEEIRTCHPALPVLLHPAIGEMDLVLDAMVQAIAARLPETQPPADLTGSD